jgi:glycosyltransferase involved in cell wall biosynthesis
VHLFSSPTAQSADIPLTTTAGWDLRSLRDIAKWARAARLDLINLQFQTAAFQMSPWIHFAPDVLRNWPVITTFHDLRFPYLFPKAGPLRDWIVMRLARRSAGVIVTNHEDAACVPHLRHRLIPIGSNILDTLDADFDPSVWREQAGAEPGDFLLAFFGLINHSKGLNTLLASLAELRGDGIPARLVIIGGTAGTSDPTNRAYLKTIEQLIADDHLSPYIHRTGFLENEAEVGSYLKASDAVVLPFADGASFRRGSLMAAIHYGGAIVTTPPRVAIPEFVDGDNLLYVQGTLTTTLKRLYHAPQLRDRLRQGSQALARHFDWQHIAGAYLDFFKEVSRP